MPANFDDLRATAEDLIEDADKLKAIEARKMELAPDDPAAVDLAEASQELVQEMTVKAKGQRAVVEEASRESG